MFKIISDRKDKNSRDMPIYIHMSISTNYFILAVKKSENFWLRAHLQYYFIFVLWLLKYTKNSSPLRNIKGNAFEYAIFRHFTNNNIATVQEIEN